MCMLGGTCAGFRAKTVEISGHLLFPQRRFLKITSRPSYKSCATNRKFTPWTNPLIRHPKNRETEKTCSAAASKCLPRCPRKSARPTLPATMLMSRPGCTFQLNQQSSLRKTRIFVAGLIAEIGENNSDLIVSVRQSQQNWCKSSLASNQNRPVWGFFHK